MNMLAALALVIIAVWFIPIYLKNKIYTMPQFWKTRYTQTRSADYGDLLVVFFMCFVNLTSSLYLGANCRNGFIALGTNTLHTVMIALAILP